jgi:hypothetical protein
MEICLIIDAVIGALDLFSIVYDIIAFLMSRENRRARREARRAGEAPPEKDKWTRRFYTFSALALVLTAYLTIRTFW